MSLLKRLGLLLGLTTLCLGLTVNAVTAGAAASSASSAATAGTIGSGGGCDANIVKSGQYRTTQLDVVFDQWQYRSGTRRCWQAHDAFGRASVWKVKVTEKHMTTGVRTVTKKQFTNSFAIWGDFRTSTHIVDVKISKYSAGEAARTIKVRLNAH